MQNSVLSAAEGTSWKDHHANVNRLIDYYSLQRNNAVNFALRVGYRHVDTARIYGNEADVGEAVRESGVPRGDLFVTTKLWNSDQGYDSTLRACEASLKRLGLDYLDLYLVHFPVPDVRKETWSAMETLLKKERCRAIGVSNFTIRHLEELIEESHVIPSVNQVEFHPFLYQRATEILSKEGNPSRGL